MKRARKKNGKAAVPKKEFSGYRSDMLDLGYDPDAEETADAAQDTEAAQTGETDVISDSAVPAENEGIEEIAENPESETQPEDSANYDEEDAAAEKMPKKKKKTKKPLIFVVSLLTIICIFAAALGFGGFFSDPAGEDDADDAYTVPVDKGTGKINILLLGVDKDGLRTDTMILASYDMDANSVKLLSIPRDTRMYIGNKYQKINAAHAISQNGKIKGVQGSIEAVTRLTAIPINYYVEFSFDAFKHTIDALGGIDFDVPQNMNYEDPTQDLYIHLTKGFQHLDGDKAEQFVRFRSYPMGDIARVAAQQSFIKALAEQKLNSSIIANVPDLYNVLKEDIKTNFTLSDVIKYANNLADLSAENITMYQLPGAFGGGEYTTSYWIADMTELKTLVETEFGYDAQNATIDSADGQSRSKDSADRRKTQPPATKNPTKTTSPAKTSKPTHTVAPTHTDSPAHTATHKPSASHTAAPTAVPTHTQEPTKEPAKTQTPTEKPTEKPTEDATKRPSRPTPNPDNE